MVNTKELIYKKAYKQLSEVFKRLSSDELSKIPNQLIENINADMDKDYIWEYDESKRLEEQDFLVETKALIVEIYEKYLCPEDKKEFWDKYDQICFNMIEEERNKKYNTDNIFKNKQTEVKLEEQNVNLPASIKRESIFKKIIGFIKKCFKAKH